MAISEKGFLLVRGALLADASKRRGEPADLLIEDGVIHSVGRRPCRRPRARRSSMRPAC